jgi:hypothetical protein
MRLRAACLAAILAVPLCIPASACPLEAMHHLLLSSDEHVEWADFWSDLDAREALAELGYARSDLKALDRLAADPDCDDTPSVTAMRRSLRAAAAACERRLALARRATAAEAIASLRH